MQIKEVCKQFGIRQREIAEEANVTVGWVSLVLNGKRQPSDSKVIVAAWKLIHKKQQELQELQEKQNK